MSKKINVKSITDMEGNTLKIPIFNSSGDVKMENGTPATKDGMIHDFLNLIIRAFPADLMSMDNIVHGTRLKSQILEYAKTSSSIFTLEEDDYAWALKMLKDEKVGVKIFGFNLLSIIAALEDTIKEE